MKAPNVLQAALGHMQDRATTYDKPDGERSMSRSVQAFNAITGHALTEEQGWLFMGVLKQVRSQSGDFKADNYEDEAAYAALRAECAFVARGENLISSTDYINPEMCLPVHDRRIECISRDAFKMTGVRLDFDWEKSGSASDILWWRYKADAIFGNVAELLAEDNRMNIIARNGNDGEHYEQVIQVGDWVEAVNDADSQFTKGSLYRVDRVCEFSISTIDDSGDGNGWHRANFKFHARPDADGWIQWDGGDCPVNGGVLVDYRVKNAQEITGRLARHLAWDDHDDFWSITAYRPHKKGA